VDGSALSETQATALSLAGAAVVFALIVAISMASARREARSVNAVYARLASRTGGQFVPAPGNAYGHARLVYAGLAVEVSNEADWSDDERLLNDRTKITVRVPAGRSLSLPALRITRSPGRRAILDDPAVFARIVGCDPASIPATARATLLRLAQLAYEVEIRQSELVAWFTPRSAQDGQTLWPRRHLRDVDALIRLVDQTVAAAAALLR
jgi:hypothetical protein